VALHEEASMGLTFVEAVLVLLTLLTTAGETVELVHEAAAALVLVPLLLLLGVVVLAVSTRDLVDEVHDDWYLVGTC
jgi:hypothetical protein